MKEAGVITALVSLLKVLDGWEFGAILLVLIIVPLLVAYIVTSSNRVMREKLQEERIARDKEFESLRQASEKRFEAVVTMYENNAELVLGYQKVAGELTTVVHVTTKAIQRVADKVELSIKIMEEKDLSLKLMQASNNNGNNNG